MAQTHALDLRARQFAVTRTSGGLAATAGIIAGGAVHSLYGALGVGLLARFMPVLFTPLLIAGSLYMAWIGITLMRSAIVITGVGGAGASNHWQAFRRGALTCLMNPKAYLFMLAIYQQFVRPDFGPLAPQAVVMGAMTAATQLGVYGGMALVAGLALQAIVGNDRLTIWIGRSAGLLLVAVSLVTFWEGVSLE